jgi:hypothetical protein
MKLLGIKRLSLLLIGTLLFCHGVFGALHLLCYPPQSFFRCSGSERLSAPVKRGQGT